MRCCPSAVRQGEVLAPVRQFDILAPVRHGHFIASKTSPKACPISPRKTASKTLRCSVSAEREESCQSWHVLWTIKAGLYLYEQHSFHVRVREKIQVSMNFVCGQIWVELGPYSNIGLFLFKSLGFYPRPRRGDYTIYFSIF